MAHTETHSQTKGQRRVQIVSFTLYDVGIYPHEARANPGVVTISIEDLTASSSGLIIERVEKNTRARAGVIDKASERLRSRGELHLGVGHYGPMAVFWRCTSAMILR